MTLKGVAKFKGKLNCGLKMTYGIWLIFMRAVESLNICTLIGSKDLDEKVQKSYVS